MARTVERRSQHATFDPTCLRSFAVPFDRLKEKIIEVKERYGVASLVIEEGGISYGLIQALREQHVNVLDCRRRVIRKMPGNSRLPITWKPPTMSTRRIREAFSARRW
jgi:hypothetical protein